METLFINSRLSENKLSEDLYFIRGALLISDTISLSPSDVSIITTKHDYMDVTVSFQLKVKILEQIWEELPEALEVVIKCKNLYKQLSQIKNKKTKDLVLLKKITSIIDDFYKKTIFQTVNETELKDYALLLPFIEDGLVNIADLTDKEPALTNIDYHNHEPYEILLKKFKKENIPHTLFYIPNRYHSYAHPFKQINDASASDKSVAWFDFSFDLTGLKYLSLESVQKIREQTETERFAFNMYMNQWIDETMKNGLSFNDIEFYQENILPTAQYLNEALINHPLFQKVHDNEEKIFLRIGSMPVHDIWNYFHLLNFVDEAGMEKLNDYKTLPSFNGRWPVMAPFTPFHLSEHKDENQIIKRKVINLD
jgi:hypothetical protein